MAITVASAVGSFAFVPAFRTGSGDDWSLAVATVFLNLPLLIRLIGICLVTEKNWMQSLDVLIIGIFPFGSFALLCVAMRLAAIGAMS